MKLLHFRRLLQLERNIYDFNTNGGPSANKPGYYNFNDLWLRLISLPRNQLQVVLTLAILILLNHDRSLSISGRKLTCILQHVSKTQLQLAMRELTATVDSIDFDCSELLLVPNCWQLSSYYILKLIYQSKHQIMFLRLHSLFNFKAEEISQSLVKYWQKFPLSALEGSVLKSFELYLPNTFNIIV